MTYAACLAGGTEEPDSSLHFGSWRREAVSFSQEFLGLGGQTKKRSSALLSRRWQLDGAQRMCSEVVSNEM